MKKKLLLKKLKQLEASKIREGGSHEVWQSRTGKPLLIPRHNEIKEWLAKQLIKDAE